MRTRLAGAIAGWKHEVAEALGLDAEPASYLAGLATGRKQRA